MKRPGFGWLALLLALVLVFPVSAQDGTFGLSQEDFQAFTQANADSLSQTQYDFDYEVALDVQGAGFPIDVTLSGAGTLDVDSGAFSLDVNGTANTAGQQTPIEGEVRLVDDVLYFRATDPDSGEDTGWLSLNLNELDLDDLGATDMQLTNPDWDAFFDGFAQGAEIPREQLNEEAFFMMLDALAQLDPQEFIGMSIGKAEANTAAFVTELSLSDLFEAESISEVTRQFLRFANIEPSPSDAFVAGFNAIVAAAFEDTSITLEQQVDSTTGLIRSATFAVDSTIDPTDFDSPGGPISTAFTLSVQVNNYGAPSVVSAPANAVEIPSSVIEDFADGFNGGDAVVPDAVPDVGEALPEQAGGTIAIGEAAIVDLTGTDAAELTLTESGTVTITAQGLDGADPILTVRDASGEVIAENDDQDGSFSELGTFDSAIADLSVTAPVTIEVTEFGSTGGRVEVTVSGTSTGAAVPDLDLPETATEDGTVAIGEAAIVDLTGTDAAELTLTESGTVTITARGLDGADPILTVRDASGEVIAENDDQDGSFSELGAFDSAIADLSVTAPVTIEVTEFGSTGGRVEVTVSGTSTGAAVPDPDTPEAAITAETVELTCNSRAQDFTGEPGTAFTGTCPAGCSGSLWGTDVYTDDSSICTAAVHAGVIPASGGDVTFVIEPGQEEYPASEQNGVTSSQWGSWERSFSFAGAAAPDTDDDAAAADGMTVDVDMANSYTFNNDVSFSYPEGYTIQTESDVVVTLLAPTGRAFIQVYETRFLFGETDMGLDFMKSTYGQQAATTWDFTFTNDDFEAITVNGRTLHMLEFEGTQNDEPVTGAVIIVPYSTSGYGYITTYALPPAPEGIIEDSIAVAASLDG